MNQRTKYLAQSGMIASLYVVLTLISTMLSLSSGMIQVRLSECLCVLPVFVPSAIPGLAIGCLVSNLVSGCVVWDVIFGTLATLIGAICARLMKKAGIFAVIPNIIANAVAVPLILTYAYHIEEAFPILMLSVFIGETVSCFGIGWLLYGTLKKNEQLWK